MLRIAIAAGEKKPPGLHLKCVILCGAPQTYVLAAGHTVRMDERQRERLEREVDEHRARVEQLRASLQDMEDNLNQVVDAPPELARSVTALKIEMRGRLAALTLGAACLGVD